MYKVAPNVSAILMLPIFLFLFKNIFCLYCILCVLLLFFIFYILFKIPICYTGISWEFLVLLRRKKPIALKTHKINTYVRRLVKFEDPILIFARAQKLDFFDFRVLEFYRLNIGGVKTELCPSSGAASESHSSEWLLQITLRKFHRYKIAGLQLVFILLICKQAFICKLVAFTAVIFWISLQAFGGIQIPSCTHSRQNCFPTVPEI